MFKNYQEIGKIFMSRAKEYKCGFHCVAHLYALFIAQQNSER